MKRCCLAVAALIGLAAGPAAADTGYVEIIVDLSKLDQIQGPSGQGMNGGVPNTPYGPSAPQPPGPPRGGSGSGPQPPMGGSGSFRPNYGQGPQQQQEEEKAYVPDPLNSIRVIVEAKKYTRHRARLSQTVTLKYVTVEHKWGRSVIMKSALFPVLREYSELPVAKQYEREHKKALKSKSPEDWLALAGWALKHGMVKEFPKIMGELEKLAPQDPAVLAFKKVQATMSAAPEADAPSARWFLDKLKGYNASISAGGHYKVLTPPEYADKRVIDSYKDRLEETYQAFFYWFAWKGVALQVPRYRLVAVLINTPSDFENQRMIFPAAPMVADGFTARRDNVAVLSTRPTGRLFNELDKENQSAWEKGGVTSKENLLKGRLGKKALSSLSELYNQVNHQALTLVQKALEEQAELATVTHEGVIQLLAASGIPSPDGSSTIPMLPRNLLGPEWIRFGLASFFETPREAFWTEFGAPNEHYWLRFREANEEKKLDDAEAVLDGVITDRLFRQAHAANDPQKLEFARTMAWSVTYFIAEKKGPDKMIKYFQLLSQLPRDMEVDEGILRSLFIQAFGDPKTFAREWRSEMLKVTLEVSKRYDYYKKEKEELAEARKKAAEEKEDKGTGGAYPKFPSGSVGPMGGGGSANYNKMMEEYRKKMQNQGKK